MVLPTTWQLMAVVVVFMALGLSLHTEACIYIMLANLDGYQNSWARVLGPNPGDW